MQKATLEAIGVAGMANVGTQLYLADKALESYHAFGVAASLLVAVALGMRRIRRLDKFEKDLKSGGFSASN